MSNSSGMWESVKPYWEALNDFLSIPFVQFFGPIVLLGLAFLIRPVRQWLIRSWLWVWRKLFHALGIATSQELADLRDSITMPLGSPSTEGPRLIGRTVERLNLKFTLGEHIHKNIMRKQPSDVSSDTINYLLQGPFCPICNRNLLFNHYSPNIPPKHMFLLKCPSPNCTWSWPYSKVPNAESLPADQIKREAYERLDAELRLTGDLKDTI